jgi:serine/threonine protein phosphatase PrpC
MSSSEAPKPGSRFKVTACVADHIGDRADQQDRVALFTSEHRPGCLLAVLADGMGGRSGGRLASDQVLSTAGNLFDAPPEHGQEPRELLSQIANEAHAVIRLTAIASEKEPHSTLVALHLHREAAIWIHAGDSRLYHVRGGRLAQRTIDHSYASRITADGRLVEVGAVTDRLKNVLFSALGIGHELRLDFGSVTDLQAGDAFLLGSDGLWAHFTDREIAATVSRHPVREAAQVLVDEARRRARGGGDNLSIALVKLEPV